jgi:hypothetical protein
VEDDLSLGKLVRKVLDKYGYRVLEAANGKKALRVAGERDGLIHLLITDVVMPKMSGREVSDSLQSLRPEVKVLYMSGYTISTVSHYGVLEKEANFIKKPFTPEGLALKVREVMDKKQN